MALTAGTMAIECTAPVVLAMRRTTMAGWGCIDRLADDRTIEGTRLVRDRGSRVSAFE